MNEDIVNVIVKDKSFKQICNKIANRAELADDLYQHIILEILEDKAGKIRIAYQNNQLKFYFVRLALNQYRSTNTSTFSKLYRQYEPVFEYLPIQYETNEDQYDEDEDKAHELEYKLTKELIEERGWYHAKLFELYLEYGNLRALSKATKIPLVSIHQSIKETKKYVHNRLDNPQCPKWNSQLVISDILFAE